MHLHYIRKREGDLRCPVDSLVDNGIEVSRMILASLTGFTSLMKCQLILSMMTKILLNWCIKRERHKSCHLKFSSSNFWGSRLNRKESTISFFLLWIFCIIRVYSLLLLLFIKALQYKCWRSVRHQVLQPSKDVEFRTLCLKSCRQEKKIHDLQHAKRALYQASIWTTCLLLYLAAQYHHRKDVYGEKQINFLMNRFGHYSQKWL